MIFSSRFNKVLWIRNAFVLSRILLSRVVADPDPSLKLGLVVMYRTVGHKKICTINVIAASRSKHFLYFVKKQTAIKDELFHFEE
jgi:hypothetical protein